MKASLIVPTFNACERLYYNLYALNKQDYPRDKFEVIVINNGSTDNTEGMLASFRPNFRLKTIKLASNKSRSYARNRGIEKTENELIIFHDSDMLPNKDFIRKHIESHPSENTIVCGNLNKKIFTFYYSNYNNAQKNLFNRYMGRYIKMKGINPLTDKKPIIKKEQILNGIYLNHHFDVRLYYNELIEQYSTSLDGFNFKWLFFITRNCSASKKSIIDAGLFDENFTGWGGEDTDLGVRLFERGHEFIYNPDIISIHQEHPKISTDMEQTERNRAYLIKKYNSINLLLFYLYKHIGLGYSELNKVISDVRSIEERHPGNDLVSLFQDGLVALRNKLYNDSLIQIPIDLNIDETTKKCLLLIRDYNAIHFIEALKKLYKTIYDVSLKV